MRASLSILTVMLLATATPGVAQDAYDSASGRVRIVNGPNNEKSVAVGDKVLPLGDSYASLEKKIGALILISISSGGTACPATFAWLDTRPGKVGLTESFGTCSDLAEVSNNAETVTVTMPSLDPSVGRVAYDYDGRTVTERQLGLESSPVINTASRDSSVLLGVHPSTYLSAAETEADLISLIGWEDLDELRNTLVIASGMTQEGDWIVGSGCRPHACDSDFAAIGIKRTTGQFIAAIKLDGARARLLSAPTEGPLPPALRKVLTTR